MLQYIINIQNIQYLLVNLLNRFYNITIGDHTNGIDELRSMGLFPMACNPELTFIEAVDPVCGLMDSSNVDETQYKKIKNISYGLQLTTDYIIILLWQPQWMK